MAPPMKLRDALTSRLKIMAKLDISEKRLPQDGRIKIRIKLEERNKRPRLPRLRLPTLFGEKIVMRLLDKTKLLLDMTKLGFEPESLRRFKDAISKPVRHGARHRAHRLGQDEHALLGDRRSSTRPTRNIMTAEDPVEFNLAGINQVQMKEQIGLNFAAALRVVPAPGPEHHPGRRDPRLRDRRDRGQGRAHRPPRALDAPHQRRAVDDQPPDEHGHRAVPRRHLGQLHLRAAAGRAASAANCKEEVEMPPQALIKIGFKNDEVKTAASHARAAAASGATTPATRAASASTRCMEFTDEIREHDPLRRHRRSSSSARRSRRA